MAPEQARGQAVDARTDLFAPGAVLYEMLSGRRAFRRDTSAETMAAILREDPPEFGASRADVPLSLDRIVRHCLEKNPTERFQNARDVTFALEALSDSRSAPTSGQALSTTADPGPRRRRRQAIVGVAVAGLSVLMFWAGQTWMGWRHPNVQPTSRRLTFDQGFVFAARFAAAGQRIVYSANWNDRPSEIFETSVDSPASRPLHLERADLLALSRTGQLAILQNPAIGSNLYDRTGTLARGISLNGGVPKEESRGVRFAGRWTMTALGIPPTAASEALILGMRLIPSLGLLGVPMNFIVLSRLLAMVNTVRTGDPFVAQNAARLQAIAYAVLGQQLLQLTIGAIARSASTPAHPLRISEFSTGGWLARVLLFVLARVFAEGTLMRDELAGTV
jgi:hypothetical protein